jgi:hypothetical protein
MQISKSIGLFYILIFLLNLTSSNSNANANANEYKCNDNDVSRIKIGNLEISASGWQSTCPPGVFCFWENPMHEFEIRVNDPENIYYDMASVWMITFDDSSKKKPNFMGDYFFKTHKSASYSFRIWIPEVQLYSNLFKVEIWKEYDHKKAEVIEFNVSGRMLLELSDSRFNCVLSVPSESS